MSAVPQPASHSLAESFACAARVLARVLAGQSLSAALDAFKLRSAAPLAAAAQDLCYGALRGYGVVDALLERLLERPLADRVLRGLLFAALAELLARPQSAHAIVHQAVEACAALGRVRAKALVNAVLRGYLRGAASLLPPIQAQERGRYRHPPWWVEALRAAHPERWSAILDESNRHPPMTLRVNRRRTTPEKYLARLREVGIAARALGACALLLERPRPVQALPGFAEGEVSVQDAGAQFAAPLLDVRDGMRVLDACAAPGGKTGHILELADCELVAVDADAARAARISENLRRLNLAARVVVADVREPRAYSAGARFERILLDAPCSGSGVSRRHPDIRWLRRLSDVGQFSRLQDELLEALWPVLAPGGKLLYTTCSVFVEENAQRVDAFVARHPDAVRLALPGLGDGQILPSAESDGFFYALLGKRD